MGRSNFHQVRAVRRPMNVDVLTGTVAARLENLLERTLHSGAN
jgi:hypothetical protein